MSLTLVLIYIFSFIGFFYVYLYQRGKNKTSIPIYDEITRNFSNRTLYSIEYTILYSYPAKVKVKDINELAKLHDYLKKIEFNLPVRSFHKCRKLRLRIEQFLREFKKPKIWNYKKENLILNRIELGKSRFPKKATRYDFDVYYGKHLKEMNKEIHKMRKEYKVFLKFLSKKWILSFL